MSVYIFGHINPDTDSITSAIAYSYLKNKLGFETKPYRLGPLNQESKFVLDYFQVDSPEKINNVKIQLKDLKYDNIEPLLSDTSILYAYNHMNENGIRTQPIVDRDNKLIGIVTMKDIAMSLVSGDHYSINTSLNNIISDLDAELINAGSENIIGKMVVTAYHYNTIRKQKVIGSDTILIVGDRYDIIKLAISKGAKLIILTGGTYLPKNLIKQCEEKKINVVSTPLDSYSTAKYINQVNFLSSIMINKVSKFYDNEYLEDFKEEIQNNKHSNYPIVNRKMDYLGMVNRGHILNPAKKEVILVDHNEYRQSAEGLHEAEVLEIIDHHKLGDISTTLPISFRNSPYGSTNTIIYQLYKENNIDIDKKIAGLMLSGIISDTLLLKSPTTTSVDRQVIKELNNIVGLDIKKFAMKMFKKGTSLEGQSIPEVFYKDFKEFFINGFKVGISQVFTLDIFEVYNKKSDYVEFIDEIFQSKEHYLTLMLVTDILKEGSYLLFKAKNKQLISIAFDKKIKQGDYVKYLVSRKKQVIPNLTEAINILE